MITYNHEKYIGQALDSVLMQRTDFEYDILIGEDCSTDRTREIIQQYSETHPARIKPICRDKNLGMKHNFVDTLLHCQGKYVAVLSGDDYWIDPYKLQKQVEFLEHNDEYVLVCHNSLCLNESDGFSQAHLVKNVAQSFDFTTKDLILYNPCIASQVMFKNHLVKEFPPVYYQSTGEDRRLYILLSLQGKCRFEYDVVGVYRIHRSSITNSRVTYDQQLKAMQESIRNAENWNKYLGSMYKREVEIVRRETSKKIVVQSIKHLNFHNAIFYSQFVDPSSIVTKKSKFVLNFLNALNRIRFH